MNSNNRQIAEAYASMYSNCGTPSRSGSSAMERHNISEAYRSCKSGCDDYGLFYSDLAAKLGGSCNESVEQMASRMNPGITTPEELKKFVDTNGENVMKAAEKMSDEDRPAYLKAWDLLCSAVGKGMGFIVDHWWPLLKLALLVFLGWKLYDLIKNFDFKDSLDTAMDLLKKAKDDAVVAANALGNMAVGAVKDPVRAAKAYVRQAAKIGAASDAATQATGRPVNLWNGAGLGGGLR